MSRTQFGQRVAVIQANFINKELRGGVIVFGDCDYTDDTTAEDYAGLGFTFVAKYRETDYGDTFGGYVSSPKLDKDAKEYPESSFYINLNPYTGENENIAYMVTLTKVDGREFGEKLFGGILYKGALKGFCQGTLSTLIAEEEDEPAPKRGKGKKQAQSKQPSAKQSYSKPNPEVDYDDIPF